MKPIFTNLEGDTLQEPVAEVVDVLSDSDFHDSLGELVSDSLRQFQVLRVHLGSSNDRSDGNVIVGVALFCRDKKCLKTEDNGRNTKQLTRRLAKST